MTDNEPEAQSVIGCKHCPTRELCQCPSGPEKCALRDCPCDATCPCPSKRWCPDCDDCPWPAACGRLGAAGGLTTLVAFVVLSALGWNDAPFAAMALLLILIPIALGFVLAIGSMGRFGRRAAVPFVFPRWTTIVFGLFGLGLIAAGIAALVGSEILAALPLLIVAAMFLLVAWWGQSVLVCRLMPTLVILGILLASLTGFGFGIAAIVRADEPLAGIGLLGIGAVLALAVLWPWWSTCRGGQYAHLGRGVAWLFLTPWLVMVVLAGFVLIGGLDPDHDPREQSTRLDTTDTATDDTTRTDTATDDTTNSNTATDDTTNDAAPVDPQCVTAAVAAGVSPVVLQEVWQNQMPRVPEWQSSTVVPANLGPSIRSYGAAMDGENLVAIVVLDAAPPDTGFDGAGTQLGLGFTKEPDPPIAGPGGFAEGFSHLWYLTEGREVQGFDADSDFVRLEGGTGIISGACAIYNVPTPDPPLFVRFGNFWRVPTGLEPTDGDPTAFQISVMYRF